MTSIQLEIDQDRVATLTFNRPSVRNALDWAAMRLFAETIAKMQDEAIAALILRGAGESFCAGGDLLDLHRHPTEEDGRRMGELMREALHRLERLPYPTMAAIEGSAIGGGAEIALACDLRFMAQDATLQLVQIRLGVMPGWGGGQRLLRLAGYSQAVYWLASGQAIEAQQALAGGLINRITPSGQAYPDARSLAEELVRYEGAALASIKAALLAGLDHSPDQAMEIEGALFPPLWASPAHQRASQAVIDRLHRDDQ